MHSPRYQSLRFRPAVRYVALLSAVALIGACTSTVGGSAAVPAPVSTSSSPAGSSAVGQITEPSVLPGGSATTAPATTPSTSAGTAPTTASSAGPAGPVPKGLEKFYNQKLAWQSCPSYVTTADESKSYALKQVQCARLTVPLVYANPTGPTIRVAVLRSVATGASARIGSLVLDPGGPGVSGMSSVASLVAANIQSKPAATSATAIELNKKFDLVGIDPRGVGSSLPAVDCQTDAQQDAARTMVLRSRNQPDVDAGNARTRLLVAACVANSGKAEGIDGKTFLANIGTRDAVRDMDVLRAVLGDKKLTYLGFSYGTELGWAYAEQFAANVRAILFDGVKSPDQDPSITDIAQSKSFQNAFTAFAAWCAAKSGCPLGTDPSTSLAAYESLVRPLLDQQLTLPGGRTMSFTDATTGTAQALYDSRLWPALAAGLSGLAKGDGRILMELADFYDERDTAGHYSNAQEAFNAIRCVDGPALTDPAKVTAFNAALSAAAPFEATGDPAGAVLDICGAWPVPPTLLPHKLRISGMPKTLVISTTGDPATPYQNGVDLSAQIGATLLTVGGTRHTSYLGAGITCVDTIGTAYLESLKLPAAATTCP